MTPRLRPSNDGGKSVDPVPFVVATAIGFLACFAWGPPYFTALGFTLLEGVAITTVAFLGVVAVAYHRLVWRARPDLRSEVPGEIRFRRLVYAVFLLLVLFGLLALPLVLR